MIYLGIKVCFIFSLSGIIFLSTIGILLFINSPYIKVSLQNSNRKPKLAEGISGAILMYAGCLAISGYLLYKSSLENQYQDDDGHLLE